MPIPDDCSVNDLATALYRRLTAHPPDWTDESATDPGVVLVQLFAFLCETLLYRSNMLPEHSKARIVRLAQRALSIPAAKNAPQTASLTRPRYFPGQLLSAEDFEAEQLYTRERMRRHNRELHGFGIVRGLGVSVEPGDMEQGGRVVLGPGFAIAPDGEEITVPDGATQPLPLEGCTLFVTLGYSERPARPVPVGVGTDTVFTRVEESFALAVEEKVPADKVILARLIHVGACWCVDQSFDALRVGCVT